MRRAGVVELVAGLAGLEEDVRDSGPCRGAAAAPATAPGARCAATRSMSIICAHVVLGQLLDLVHFVRDAETVEEVQERHAGLERRRVGDQGHVLRLLHRIRGEHRPAGAAAGHHVAVVAENRQGVRGHGAGGDVEDRRGQLPGDLEHVGDHQQQALRRREGGRQGPGLQRAVDRARRPPLRSAFLRHWARCRKYSFGRRPPRRRASHPSSTRA